MQIGKWKSESHQIAIPIEKKGNNIETRIGTENVHFFS